MSELSSVAGLHNHAHTYSEAETDTRFFFSAQWEAAAKHSVDAPNCLSVTTLRIPQMLFTCDANIPFPLPVCDDDALYTDSSDHNGT